MKKRLIMITLTLALLAVSLAGCGLLGRKDTDVDRSSLYEKLEEKVREQGEDLKEKVPHKDGGDQEMLSIDSELLSELSLWTFRFSSGAGAWETYLNIAEDGSFSGEYYDANMGEDGPGYPDGTMYRCVFNGQFGEWTQKSDYVWTVQVTSMEYENEPGTEEIVEGTKYIYTEPYGLEGLLDQTNELYVYLPGTPVEILPEEYLDWVAPMHFGTYIGEESDYVRDDPEDLPFCGLYNTAGEGFFSDNTSPTNRTYLANRVKCPGLKPAMSEMHEDGTYIYEDMDGGGMVCVTNACIPTTKSYDTWSDPDTFVKDVLAIVLGPGVCHDVYAMTREDASVYASDKSSISGYNCIFATWDEGGNEDTRYGMGCFMEDVNYESDYSFAYMYAVSLSQYNEILSNEAMNFYLGSLELTGDQEKISSASELGASDRILVEAIPAGTREILTGDEVEWVTESDTDLIEKYNLDPDEFYDDYQIGGFDATYTDYPMDPGCIFYVQYPEDGYHKLVDLDTYTNYIGRFEDGTLMNFIRDENGKVVFVYEPYTP